MEEKKLMVFERKAQKKIIGQVQYEETGKWNARQYNQLRGTRFQETKHIGHYQEPTTIKVGGHARQSLNQLLRMIKEDNPVGKR